ncbi:hypothetical protein SGCOL_007058 [Colletotrichum sp. CLE4]
MPDDVAHQTLKKLKFAVDPYAALRAIRPSGPKDAREVLPHISSNIEFELTRRHPILYPQTRRFGRLEMPESIDSRPSKAARVEDASEEGSILEDRRAPEYPTVAEVLEDSPSTASPKPSRAFDSAFFVPPMGPIPPPTPRIRNEPRLRDLNIAFWTVVPISNQDAAEVISLYLETDHPILGLFDVDLFLNDLVYGEVRYCSSLLVNALLAFACQAYAAKQPEASRWSQELEDESNKLWHAHNDDTLPTIAALAFLIQSSGCNGNGELNVKFIKDTAAMAKRLKLFGCPDAYTFVDLNRLMTAQFCLPATTEYPPTLPMPGKARLGNPALGSEHKRSSSANSTAPSSDSDARSQSRNRTKRGRSPATSDTFAAFCELWVISSQITWVYQHETSPGHSSQAFALEKYSKLLSWADNLAESMERDEHSPSHVLACHMWFHGTVLYLLRPFIPSDKQHGFKFWSPSADQIPAFFAASVEQLKDLVEVYALYPESTYSIFGHTALIHVANAVASDITNPEWRPYFLSCIRAYQALYSSFTVAEVIAGGLLSMVVRKGGMDMTEALGLLQDLRARKGPKAGGRATGMFVTDLDLAVTDREAARVDRLIENFEEMTILDEFTQGVI